jgi:hypothetical protein
VSTNPHIQRIGLRWFPIWGALIDLGLFIFSFVFFGGSHGPIGPMIVLHVINAPMSRLGQWLVPMERSSDTLDLALAFSSVTLNGALYGLGVAIFVAGWRALLRRRS